MAFGVTGRDEAEVVVQPPLSQAVGYVVVLVIGLVIAFSTCHSVKIFPNAHIS